MRTWKHNMQNQTTMRHLNKIMDNTTYENKSDTEAWAEQYRMRRINFKINHCHNI